MGKFNDLTGQRFGKLTVIKRVGSDCHKNALWLCECDCGSGTTIVPGTKLVLGKIKSCGCYRSNVLATIHKKYFDPWVKYLAIHKLGAMKARCYDRSREDYPRYGGRGITICDEWLNDPLLFAKWSLENGYKPGLSIDRIDNNKGYSPDNCRWIPLNKQSSNRRICRYLIVNNEAKTIGEWADIIGVHRSGLYRKSDDEVVEIVSNFLDQRELSQSGLCF